MMGSSIANVWISRSKHIRQVRSRWSIHDNDNNNEIVSHWHPSKIHPQVFRKYTDEICIMHSFKCWQRYHVGQHVSLGYKHWSKKLWHSECRPSQNLRSLSQGCSVITVLVIGTKIWCIQLWSSGTSIWLIHWYTLFIFWGKVNTSLCVRIL